MEENNQVQVLVPLPLSEPFNYKVPEGMRIAVGEIVQVPFGNAERRGVVWSKVSGVRSQVPENKKAETYNLQPETSSEKKYKLKEIIKKLDAPPLPENTLKFIDWVADYTLSPRGAVFAMVVSVKDALDPPKPVLGYRIKESGIKNLESGIKVTKARQKVLDFLKNNNGAIMTLAELAKEAGVGKAVVKGLAKAGALEEVALKEKNIPIIENKEVVPVLSAAQSAAAGILRKNVKEKKYSATLLDGVTGSGKTEVYFEAIKEALESGMQALVLLPEIVLTAQLLERFKKRFGFAPTEWHSGLTPAKRRKNWRAIAQGEARLIIGARSALFLPYPELGVIVVDEEHEVAFKQDEGVVYHGRDMAVVRAHIENIPIVLVSATPSIETMVNVSSGKYSHLHLPERHGFAQMPVIDIVDMRQEKLNAKHWLSNELRESMVHAMERREQILLYLNRRGYAPLTLCRHCGFRYKCPECSAWLVKHKFADYLQCHHCGHKEKISKQCPECKVEGGLAECGPGVERLEEEVKEFLPQARIILMTSDTTESPRAAQEIIQAILEKRVDVIIGTQLVTKGHHFPNLTLVGIVDADLGLEGGDLRAAEKTYQILHQVSGRAGREDKGGRAIIQSYMPEHNVMHALLSGDRDEFIRSEIGARQVTNMPPFGRLAAMIFSGTNEAKVKQAAYELAKAAPRGPGIEILGPAAAPLSLLRGKFRYRILVKTERKINIQKMLRTWTKKVKTPSNIRLKVDIDPYNFV